VSLQMLHPWGKRVSAGNLDIAKISAVIQVDSPGTVVIIRGARVPVTVHGYYLPQSGSKYIFQDSKKNELRNNSAPLFRG
jgi:hypothetical protein